MRFYPPCSARTAKIDAPKAPDYNGCEQIMHPGREMGAGLKILVSAVQSRPSPPFRFLSFRALTHTRRPLATRRTAST